MAERRGRKTGVAAGVRDARSATRARVRGAPRAALAAGVAVAALGCADLASTRDVRVTVVDEQSRPVPGAVFYVEASDAAGAFAFRWRFTGQAGEVPDSAREPLKIPWRRGARLAMVAFAPGHHPALVRETDRRVVSDGAVLVLEPGPAWHPDLALLDLPFEDAPDLAALVAEPACAPLLAAFGQAWAAAPPGSLSPEAERKRAALAGMLSPDANPAQGTGRSSRS